MASFKFEVEELPRETTVAGQCRESPRTYTGYGFIRVNPTRCILPGRFRDYIDTIRNFEVHPEDVYLISNPKCGTTWSMEMVWMIANDLDFEKAKIDQQVRFPHIDLKGCVDDEMLQFVIKEPIMDLLNNTKGARYIKSHLPKDLLPTQIWTKKPKVIFIVRNPKDAAVSNFHHYKNFHNYEGSLEDFLNATLKDEVFYSPFWDQVLDFWNMRNEPHVLFLKYEDMKKDFPATIRKTAEFLGKTLTDEQVNQLIDYLSLDKMKTNRAVNYEPIKELISQSKFPSTNKGSFIREGKSGGWRANMDPEMVKRFDDWSRAKIAGTGLDEIYL